MTAPHAFARPGTYPVAVHVESDGAVAVGAVDVVVTRDETLVGAFDNVCLGDLGSVAADCDGQGSGYPRDQVAASGFVPGTTVAVPGTDLTFDLPEVAPGRPDNATGAGQVIQLDLGAGAEQVAVIGTATESAKRLTGVLAYADGVSEDVALEFGDWVGAAGSPEYGNVVAGVTPWRLSGTGREGRDMRTAVYASLPHTLRTESAVVSLTLPVEEGTLRDQGRIHVFAVASDGERSAATPLSVTGAPVDDQRTGEAFEAGLATVAGGLRGAATATATVGWGDGTVVEGAVVVGGTVRAGHTYPAAGTYTATVTVDDGVESAAAEVSIVVVTADSVDAGPPPPAPEPGPGAATTVGSTTDLAPDGLRIGTLAWTGPVALSALALLALGLLVVGGLLVGRNRRSGARVAAAVQRLTRWGA